MSKPADKVVRYRKGKPVEFDRANIEAIKRWRQRKQRARLEKLAQEIGVKSEVSAAHAKAWNLFSDEEGNE